MNLTSPNQFKSASLQNELNDDKMDQIRELLFGEFERQSQTKVTELEARIKELELSVHHRLDALQARLDELAVNVSDDHRNAFDELARGISDLGDRIKNARKA